ncbi:Bile salt-activated lipase [Zootermopsis nevadensis]|uniref:Bile salt-activated lipase n=1 Tax=Zootermopsis nevadensis TaxID=136037 RepID=A0A067QVW8_ZOONE|nr:Bile salt-activated lipase [Zootermopsis nevadensis]
MVSRIGWMAVVLSRQLQCPRLVASTIGQLGARLIRKLPPPRYRHPGASPKIKSKKPGDVIKTSKNKSNISRATDTPDFNFNFDRPDDDKIASFTAFSIATVAKTGGIELMLKTPEPPPKPPAPPDGYPPAPPAPPDGYPPAPPAPPDGYPPAPPAPPDGYPPAPPSPPDGYPLAPPAPPDGYPPAPPAPPEEYPLPPAPSAPPSYLISVWFEVLEHILPTFFKTLLNCLKHSYSQKIHHRPCHFHIHCSNRIQLQRKLRWNPFLIRSRNHRFRHLVHHKYQKVLNSHRGYHFDCHQALHRCWKVLSQRSVQNHFVHHQEYHKCLKEIHRNHSDLRQELHLNLFVRHQEPRKCLKEIHRNHSVRRQERRKCQKVLCCLHYVRIHFEIHLELHKYWTEHHFREFHLRSHFDFHLERHKCWTEHHFREFHLRSHFDFHLERHKCWKVLSLLQYVRVQFEIHLRLRLLEMHHQNHSVHRQEHHKFTSSLGGVPYAGAGTNETASNSPSRLHGEVLHTGVAASWYNAKDVTVWGRVPYSTPRIKNVKHFLCPQKCLKAST